MPQGVQHVWLNLGLAAHHGGVSHLLQLLVNLKFKAPPQRLVNLKFTAGLARGKLQKLLLGPGRQVTGRGLGELLWLLSEQNAPVRNSMMSSSSP